jgi:hypothetical protein
MEASSIKLLEFIRNGTLKGALYVRQTENLEETGQELLS